MNTNIASKSSNLKDSKKEEWVKKKLRAKFNEPFGRTNVKMPFRISSPRELGTRMKGAIKRRPDRPYSEITFYEDDKYEHFEEFLTKYENENFRLKNIAKLKAKPGQIPDSSICNGQISLDYHKNRKPVTNDWKLKNDSLEPKAAKFHTEKKKSITPIIADKRCARSTVPKSIDNIEALSVSMSARVRKAKTRITAKPWPSIMYGKEQCCHAAYRKKPHGYLCMQCHSSFRRRKDLDTFKVKSQKERATITRNESKHETNIK